MESGGEHVCVDVCMFEGGGSASDERWCGVERFGGGRCLRGRVGLSHS